MNNKRFGLIPIFIVFAVVIWIVMTRSEPEKKVDSISVGVILPLSGDLAVLGQNEATLLRAAEEVINQKRQGKPHLKLWIEDAAFDAKKAATIANLFVTQKLPIVMVSTTPLAGPVVPITEQNGQLAVLHNMTEALLINTHLTLRIYPGIRDEIEAIISWLNDQTGDESIFALRLDSEWSTQWVEAFRNMAPSIKLHDEPYTMARLNARDSLAKVRASNATHILLLGYGQEYPSLIKQIREAGITLPIIGNIGFAYAGTRASAKKNGDQNLLTGCVFPYLTGNMKSKDISALQSVYDRKGKGDVLEEPGALYFFDTLVMLMNAVDEVGLEPEKIRRNIITNQNPFQGITGQISFTEDGNSHTQLSMAQYDAAGHIVPVTK